MMEMPDGLPAANGLSLYCDQGYGTLTLSLSEGTSFNLQNWGGLVIPGEASIQQLTLTSEVLTVNFGPGYVGAITVGVQLIPGSTATAAGNFVSDGISISWEGQIGGSIALSPGQQISIS